MTKHRLWRGLFIALMAGLLGSAVYYSSPLEVTVGLDTLFQLRGVRKPPSEVVVVAMDEPSENRLAVGQDLKIWRKYHANVIQQLQRQGAALIIFDLHFFKTYLGHDKILASAMRTAGNVLIMDCLQKINHKNKEFSGREECSESNKLPTENLEASDVELRVFPPKALFAKSVLDHATFTLSDDAGKTVIREVSPFIDGMLSKTPTLPLLAWFHYLVRYEGLTGVVQPYSDWLSKKRWQCLSGQNEAAEDIEFIPHQKNDVLPFIRTLTRVLCTEDTQYLDFYGPPLTLRVESYSDIYDGKVTDLKDKVIFIGKSNRQFSPGKTDFFPTPFTDSESGKMAGVEIMATEFANFLEGRFIRAPMPPAILFTLYGLIIGLVYTTVPGLLSSLFSLGLTVAYVAFAVWCFKQDGYWLPILVPTVILLPTLSFTYLVLSRRDLQKEMDKIMPFVLEIFPDKLADLPKYVGNWRARKPNPTVSTEQEVSGICLATDIEGYTRVAEKYSNHQLWELLKDYYQVLGSPVEANKGNVANVQGDAMMAYWIDNTQSNHRLLACLAALDIQVGVQHFNDTSGHDSLPTRIGLHAGDFLLGRGVSGKLRFSNPFGDSLTTVSRIEGANKYLHTRILASTAVVKGLTEIVFRPVGFFHLRGRVEPVELVELMGLATDLTAQQTDLIAQFSEGLYNFQQGHWEQAKAVFKSLMDNNADGPSQFYWLHMESYPGSPPVDWNGIITLPDK